MITLLLTSSFWKELSRCCKQDGPQQGSNNKQPPCSLLLAYWQLCSWINKLGLFHFSQTSKRERNELAMQGHVTGHLDLKATNSSHYLFCPAAGWPRRSRSCEVVCNCRWHRSMRSRCKLLLLICMWWDVEKISAGVLFRSCVWVASCTRELKRDVTSEEKRHVVLPKKEDTEAHVLNPRTFCPKFHVCREE